MTITAQPSLFAASPKALAPTGPALELDPEQQAAAETGGGCVFVRAGAGTGKTRTITSRIGYLVRTMGVQPEGITVATFTNKAAGEIRERVAHFLGADVARRIQMGTFHSLGARFLRRNAERIGLRRDFVVVDEDDAQRILKDVVASGGYVAESADAGPLLAAAGKAIRRWKSWGLTVDMIESPGRARRSAEEERLARVYVAYQHELRRRGMVDFGDLVLLPVEILNRDVELRASEAGRVVHMLVDEAQDANPTQVLFARMMTSVHRNLFAVGDEDQSIFSFQGGYPAAIRTLAGTGAREFTLVRNRRCTDEILEPAVTLVSWNRRTGRKVLESGRAGPKPSLTVAGSEREEAARVADKVREYVAQGAPLGQIAILARSAFAFAPMEEALLKAGVPYDVTGGVPFVEREEVKDVIAYLRLALNPYDALAFERIANRPLRGLGPQAVEALLLRQERSGDEFAKVCAALTELDGVRLTGPHRAGLDALGKALTGLAAGYDAELPSVALLSMVLDDKGVGYESFIDGSKDKNKRRRLDNIQAMRRIAHEEPDPWSFLERLALAGDEDVVPSVDRVRISTMHSSKGLEWDHVLCVGFDSAVIPSPRALEEGVSGSAGDPWCGPQGGGLEEERRLAHVAFTRARKTLDISMTLTRNGRTVEPSVFLPESGLDPYAGFDPFALKGRAGKGGKKAAPRFGRKGFERNG